MIRVSTTVPLLGLGPVRMYGRSLGPYVWDDSGSDLVTPHPTTLFPITNFFSSGTNGPRHPLLKNVLNPTRFGPKFPTFCTSTSILLISLSLVPGVIPSVTLVSNSRVVSCLCLYSTRTYLGTGYDPSVPVLYPVQPLPVQYSLEFATRLLIPGLLCPSP